MVLARLICFLVGHVTPLTKIRDGVIVVRQGATADPDHWRRCLRCGVVAEDSRP